MNHKELPEYVKELIYRAIATKLKIRKEDLFVSPEAKSKVDHCLIVVKAIADSKMPTLDGAVNNVLAIYSARGEVVSRRVIERDVNNFYETFSNEIAGIERMNEMHRLKIEASAIWDFLRSRIRVGNEYEDEWLEAADAWILRGEKRHIELGTAEICSFSNPEDQAKFVQQVIEIEAAKRKTPNTN